jgi:hypothetical protein
MGRLRGVAGPTAPAALLHMREWGQAIQDRVLPSMPGQVVDIPPQSMAAVVTAAAAVWVLIIAFRTTGGCLADGMVAVVVLGSRWPHSRGAARVGSGVGDGRHNKHACSEAVVVSGGLRCAL